MERRTAATLVLVLALTAGACDERGGGRRGNGARNEIERQLGAIEPALLDTASATRLSGAFRGAAAEALTSVVQIEVVSTGVMPAPPPAPFHDFDVDSMQPRERITQGSGSGFIIDRQGHVLTNHHVIEGAVDIKVRLVDGREFPAVLVGSDPNSDVAVIRLESSTELPVAKYGDSDDLKVGDWVLALGSPLGLRFSVTAGIVSAMNRNISILGRPGSQALEAFIQTDAAINPGNSGGPLVDLMGRVVGVNSAIETRTGYFSGAGFAIPINLARKFADDLIRYGEVHRPRLGVSIRPVTAADAEIYRLPGVGGVEINSVTQGEAAARAGVKMGDVVIAINGEPVDAMPELQARVAQFKPGESIRLSIIRYGEPMELNVRLGEFERQERAGEERAVLAREGLGFSVIPLSPQYAARIGRKGRADVPLVRSVDPLSAAAEELLLPGYAILTVNGQDMNVAELRRFSSRVRRGTAVSLVVINPRAEAADRVPIIMNFKVN